MIRAIIIISSRNINNIASRTHYTSSTNTMLFSRNTLFAAAAALAAASSGSAFAPPGTCEFPRRSHDGRLEMDLVTRVCLLLDFGVTAASEYLPHFNAMIIA
jgi:hypothetical protein